MSAPTHRRAQPRHILAVQVADLRARGLPGTKIAERLQISRSYAYELITDPTGEQNRQRKEQYRGICEECGDLTSYIKGGSASRCRDCAGGEHAERNERVFEAWDRGETAPNIAAREGMTPGAVTGLVDCYRRRYGMPLSLHRVPNRMHWEHIRRRWNVDGATAAEIAKELGYRSSSNISEQIKQMRKAGLYVERRSA